MSGARVRQVRLPRTPGPASARTAIAGVRTATDSLGVQTVKWEKIQALGGAAAALGAELLGIAAVKQKCFS